MSRAEKQASKPTNRLIDTETDKNLSKKRKKNTYLQTDAQAGLLWTHVQRELGRK